MAQLYKGRYYANKDFLDSGKGYRPLYAWRSIIFGRELIQQGLIKSIGNGSSTIVWGDKWIMDVVPRRPVNKQILIDVNLKFSALMDETCNWNSELLVDLFPPNEVARIRQITPGDVRDCFTWAFSKHGAYTVKTGFEVLMKAKMVPTSALSPREQSQIVLKKRVWKIPTLPKIRMFLWRAISGAMAVADRLNSRGLTVDLTCKLCIDGVETINHVLFQCSTASQIWSKAGLEAHPDISRQTLEENLAFALNSMEDHRLPPIVRRAIPWVLWLIWKNRNSVIYAETQHSIDRLLREMSEEVELWFTLNTAQTQGLPETSGLVSNDKWCLPENGIIKCNLHANWRNAYLHSGIAWITRDHQGNVCHHARDAITFTPNRLVAELRCVIWALTSLRDLGVTKLIIALDYQEVVEALKAPHLWPKYMSLLTQVSTLKENFESLCFEGEHIRNNGIGRDIAKSVLRDGRFQSYLALGGPSWLHDRIARETCGGDCFSYLECCCSLYSYWYLGVQGLYPWLGFPIFLD